MPAFSRMTMFVVGGSPALLSACAAKTFQGKGATPILTGSNTGNYDYSAANKNEDIMKIPFYLVTGFLGSGKTTLVKRVLREHADSKRIAIIQNEFAPGNVDGAELARTGKKFEMLEINKGSVFCVCLLSDFRSSLAELVDRTQPDAVVLEATGLADPIALAQLLTAPELRSRLYLAYSWCIVDAAAFLQMERKITRIAHQVRIADHVVINKEDLAEQQMIADVEERIRDLNPFATVSHTTYGRVPLQDMFAPLIGDPAAVRRAREHAAVEAAKRPPVESTAVRSTKPVEREALVKFLNAFAADAYRIKGFVNISDGTTVAVQCTFNNIEIESIEGRLGPTELVALGEGLDTESFASSFRRIEAR
ncbi:MAG: hypothetical protein GF344_04930 [Chitinivibrionales bacterium]|nr:hypothetical protein [Chitinivibrionales bacterium]MBD3356344.1 hypothetical protein [Chitinivibrionales bacterium]